MKTLKVSIIVPVHNSEKYINDCVNSIVSQDYKNIECILVENGSNDNSQKLCQEISNKYDNVFYYTTKDAGVSNARNIGLEHATGDVIGFCDSDDLLEQHAISKVAEEFKKESFIGAVFFGINRGILNDNRIIKKKNTLRFIDEKLISPSKALEYNLVNNSIMGGVRNKYYKKELIEGKFFDESLSFCEDMHFNSLVLSQMSDSYKVKILKDYLYCYVQNIESVTNNQNLFFDDNDNLKYILSLKKIINDCKLNNKLTALVRYKIAYFAINYLNLTKISENKKKKLLIDLKTNYYYFVRNILYCNQVRNIKRLLMSFKIILLNYKMWANVS